MESDFIAWVRSRLQPGLRLLLGPGDDAAVVRLAPRADCVVTTDLLTDTVDFHLAEVDPRRVGHKALAVNLSDLAAMAARPVAVVVSLALPRRGGLQLGIDLVEGMLPLAEKHDVEIAGGDTNSWDAPLAISITAIGETTDAGLLRRGGARPGDAIVVTGRFGGSILGKHLDFSPRVDEALHLAANYPIHAGIDVSDSLSIDLAHVCRESGCGAIVKTPAIPIAPAADELAASGAGGQTALDHALSDGEDFELILAVPWAEAERLVMLQPLDVPLTIIGRFVEESGLWQVSDGGAQTRLEPRGFEHTFTQ